MKQNLKNFSKKFNDKSTYNFQNNQKPLADLKTYIINNGLNRITNNTDNLVNNNNKNYALLLRNNFENACFVNSVVQALIGLGDHFSDLVKFVINFNKIKIISY